MEDYLTSLIRTWVPVMVGAAITWLAMTLGVVLDDGTSTSLIVATTALATAVYYAAARAVEARWPQVGRLLLALGAGGGPVYPSSYRR